MPTTGPSILKEWHTTPKAAVQRTWWQHFEPDTTRTHERYYGNPVVEVVSKEGRTALLHASSACPGGRFSILLGKVRVRLLLRGDAVVRKAAIA